MNERLRDRSGLEPETMLKPGAPPHGDGLTRLTGRVEVQLTLHPPHRSGLAAFPHPALLAIMTCVAVRLPYGACDRRFPARVRYLLCRNALSRVARFPPHTPRWR